MATRMATRAGIIRAKRLAIGGKRKRCKIGKSCSAACVNRNKFCLVDMPAPVDGALVKAVKAVRTRKERLSPKQKKESLDRRREYIKNELSQRVINAITVVKNDQEWNTMGRQGRKDLVKERIKVMVERGDNTLSILEPKIRFLEMMARDSPHLNDKRLRAELLAARYLRYQALNKPLERKDNLILPTGHTTKYDKTPGSTSPIKKVDLVAHTEELERKLKEHLSLRKKFYDNFEDIKAHEQEILANRIKQSLEQIQNGYLKNPNLADIYEKQGYNSKPELVAGRRDLMNRTDLVRDDKGNPLILWRGVSSPDYASQFKGLGSGGEKHYPGNGIEGNGTYAASASPGSKFKLTVALEVARSYAGNPATPDKIIAFGVRNDANIVDFNGRNLEERESQYKQWRGRIVSEARKTLGYDFEDPGEAAAALGIHAYRVPMGEAKDYWVILNRGALVVAMDPQIDNL